MFKRWACVETKALQENAAARTQYSSLGTIS